MYQVINTIVIIRQSKKILTLLIVFLVINSCERKVKISQETFKQVVSHRNLGLAYLEENRLLDAVDEFRKLVEITPKEPLGYANLGYAYLNMSGGLEQSEAWLFKALKLAPAQSDIRFILAKVYELTAREQDAITTLENTIKKEPEHVLSLYQLALYYAGNQTSESQEKAIDYLALVVNIHPGNIVARLRLVELLLSNEKPTEAVHHMETIRQVLPRLADGSQKIFSQVLDLMRLGKGKQAIAPAIMFHNIMKPTSFYGASLNRLRGTSGPISGSPIYRFSRLAPPSRKEQNELPTALIFIDVTATSGLNIVSSTDNTMNSDNTPQTIMAYGDYDGDGDQDLFVSQWLIEQQTNKLYLFRNNNGTFSDIAADAGIMHPGRDLSAIFADYDNDGYLDLFITNSQANRLYRNAGNGSFVDVGVSAGVDTASGAMSAKFADFDMEGDLDLYLATSSNNKLYRNNLDGTFIDIGEEAGVNGQQVTSRDISFGDFDDDGDMDLFILNHRAPNRYYDNLRQGYFRDISEHTGLTNTGSGSVVAGDYNNDGHLDLFITGLTGENHSLMRNQGDGTFQRDDESDKAFSQMGDFSGLDATFFDADNDGFLDLVIAGAAQNGGNRYSGLWLLYNNGEGKYRNATELLPNNITATTQVEAVDYDNDGDLDLVLVGLQGKLRLLRNDGGNVNNYLIVQLSGLRTGSSKNNFFGIGSKVEVKSGDLYQMRVMTDPVAHFGLGNRDKADVVRVLWTNGVPQNRFHPERNQTIVETQILKGSCPWLFVWNGDEYEFATDVLWASALGMPLGIMSGEPVYAFPNSASEYFKIPGEKLIPQNEQYLLQFTTELWETPYLDRVKLLVVDHPDSIDIVVDGTFIPPPFPPFRIYTVAEKRQPLSAHDDWGNNVLGKILHADGNYVSNLTPSTYQGVTETHDLILDLGEMSSVDSVHLFLYGWLFPTDASINVNMSQSSAAGSIFPYLQVPDKDGKWKTVIENIGFPKGKNKTMVVDLTGCFLTNDYRLRIRTNMQIYWDQIYYAINVSSGSLSIAELYPLSADLHYRGFSKLTKATPYSPSIPDYHSVYTGPKWRDLTGAYTRYGDVLSLLKESDSKYVIMNAGEEISITFDATSTKKLQKGWSRDFIFYNDGWLKDGDLNTARGQTVHPLPFHGMRSYPYSPGETYPEDEELITYIKTYNTRFVTTDSFRALLRTPVK